MIDNLLRLGMFRDRPVFEAVGDQYGAIVVPAHIAAHSPDGLWGFMKGVGAKPFFYDPMTYWLWLEPRYWLLGSEANRGPALSLPVPAAQIRPAFRKLLAEYGLLDDVTTLKSGKFGLVATARLPSACLAFQRRGVVTRSAKAGPKYARILGIELDDSGFAPGRLVGAYRALELESSASWDEQAALNVGTLGALETGEVAWAVLAFESIDAATRMSEMFASRLELDQFAGVGLWVGGLDEQTADVASLQAYRALVSGLRLPVWLMFAGYFGILLSGEGVTEVSHGVFYTESKRILGPVGSGPPAERYYIQALHRFYEPTKAFQILDLLPNFACECPECPDLDTLRAGSVAAQADKAHHMAWVRKLQRHFLAARRREIETVASRSRSELLAELTETSAEVGSVPASLRAAAGLRADHLDRWVRALR